MEKSIEEIQQGNKKSIKDLKAQAEKEQKPFKTVLVERIVFLIEMMHEFNNWIECKTNEIPGMSLDDIHKELHRIQNAVKYIDHPPPANEITEEMVQDAKQVPVTSLVDFTRGVTKCLNPEHEDKNPSAYYASRTNKLICPVCNKTWDAIDVKMTTDNLTFLEAVRRLNNGCNY